MATGSKGGRTYSDPSYGSVKTAAIQWTGTFGTRATALIANWVPMNPISVIDWQMQSTVAGTTGGCSFVLAATSSEGTAALGTITFGTSGALGASNSVQEGTCTETKVAKGGVIHLYSVLGTVDPTMAFANPIFSYRETFNVSDN